MSVSGIISSAHAAFSHQTSDASASTELQALFAKLHLDAISSFSDTATSSTSSTGTAATSAAASTGTTTSTHGLISGLRNLLDEGLSVASKTASVAAKAAGAYSTGGGVGAIGSALSKLA